MVVASFHLLRFSGAAAARRLAAVPLDRRSLRHAGGARFAKVLGTGRGQKMAVSADLRRWAAFVVWDHRDDLDTFRSNHPLARSWSTADERYDVVLEPLGARGTWDGTDPLATTLPRSGSRSVTSDGPVAVLTRATVRWRQLPAFLRAVPAVDRRLADADGLLAAAGIGEWPVGRQATFSLWRDTDAVQAFAYRGPEHTEVVRRTREEDWYGEEWFARFRPVESSGTWDGVDPLR